MEDNFHDQIRNAVDFFKNKADMFLAIIRKKKIRKWKEWLKKEIVGAYNQLLEKYKSALNLANLEIKNLKATVANLEGEIKNLTR
ncbi:hypothetical protein KKG29_01685 [Patescibacteria group bacterium]|nr:hypothetical protein [Patescibacteria group bacterium]MBU3999872.1 hypothetical protein [Patescibacteria group bacterium]